jgi:Protein of unknown function (DUF1360)
VGNWFGLFVSILATWRLCHLVASEDGPFDIIVTVRRIAGKGMWGRLMDCPYCLSLWFAVPFAIIMAGGWIAGIVLWLAISGGACLIEQAAAMMRSRAEPPVIDLPKPD